MVKGVGEGDIMELSSLKGKRLGSVSLKSCTYLAPMANFILEEIRSKGF